MTITTTRDRGDRYGPMEWAQRKQEMMGWQWYQLDHTQIIRILLQTDNHTSIPSLSFLQARCCSRCPTNSVKALKA